MYAPDVNDLVESYFLLAVKTARDCAKLGGCPWLVSDFISEAGLALWQTARRYDPVKHPKFPICVRIAVRRACWKRLKHERKKHPASFQVQPSIADEDGFLLSPLDLIADDAPEIGAVLLDTDLVAKLMAGADLTERQREAVERVVGQGETQTVLAAEQGVTGKRIGQVVAAALTRLRTAGN